MTSKRASPAIPTRSGRPGKLRDDAEARLVVKPPAGDGSRPAAEVLHELQVHQVELEMQNEALRDAQTALEESRDRYVDLYEFAPVGYLTLSRQAQIAAINLTGATLLREDRKQLLRRRFSRFVVAEDQERWQRHFTRALRHDGKLSCELSLTRHDGTVFVANLDCLRSAPDNAAPTLRLTLTDISEIRQANVGLHTAMDRLEGLAAEQAAHLRRLAGELTRAEQFERDRLYERLHDDVQPLLVAARLSLSGISRRTSRENCLRVAAEACGHISQVIQVARTLSLQLSPPLIRERGLKAALESLCHWVRQNHGLAVDLNCAPGAEPDDMAVRLLCFNAVRELLMNVVKHAATAGVTVTLDCADADANANDHHLRIVVTDHGSGFDASAASSGSGLAAIERRLSMLGGSLHVDSRPGGGTIATLSAPHGPVDTAEWTDAGHERRHLKGATDAQDTDRR